MQEHTAQLSIRWIAWSVYRATSVIWFVSFLWRFSAPKIKKGLTPGVVEDTCGQTVGGWANHIEQINDHMCNEHSYRCLSVVKVLLHYIRLWLNMRYNANMKILNSPHKHTKHGGFVYPSVFAAVNN